MLARFRLKYAPPAVNSLTNTRLIDRVAIYLGETTAEHNELPNVGYVTVYPIATVTKIILAQLLLVLLR